MCYTSHKRRGCLRVSQKKENSRSPLGCEAEAETL